MAALGAAATLPATARAQDSIWDMFARDRVMRNIDTGANTAYANARVETIEPILSFDTAYNLSVAISRYEPFVAAGGWEQVPREVFGLKLGDSRRAVRTLKFRLMASGDMKPAERANDMFDEELDRAVRGFQVRHGLTADGQVGEATFYALSVPAHERLNQLRLNLARVEASAATLGDRYAVVNIPAATIEAVEGGQVSQRHTAVVGRIDRQTPILSSRIHQINFNPYWHVPKSIIQKDLIKYMNEDPEYLTKFRIRIYDGNGRELQPTQIDWSTNEAVNYMFRQEPGAENSMGHVKINFHNPHAVYLHDTPTKSLFAENARFHSSGCVRVDGVNQFVAWILRDNGGWDTEIVDGMFASNERLDVDVKAPVPIHTTYITAWANRQGTVSFRDDVYQFDAEGRVTFA
ncbi:L,D-transpeptidase family protein [Arsenicitalea aurantiaca]|nr:L,D-transpeptidase family protein [Arsenicitalea aurantiaca]